MRRLLRIANKRLSGLIGAVAVFSSEAALAHDDSDPFALPAIDPAATVKLAKDEDAFAQIIINGLEKPEIVQLRYDADRLLIACADAEAVGIKLPKCTDDFIALDEIPFLTFRFDPLQGKLDIALKRQGDGPNAIDFARAEPFLNEGLPLTALLLDYDVNVQASGAGTSVAALLNPRLTRGGLSLESAWQLNSRPGDGIDNAVRLDTSLTLYDRESGIRGVLGDYVSWSPVSSRAVRLAGIQITSDYAQRPDLITQPLPAFGGSVAVPSTVDVVIGDRRIDAGQIEPGDFSVRNVPIPVGRNSIGVVVTDALGRETIQTVTLYGARSLLAPGLSQSAFNAGFARANYGRQSNDYGIFGVTATHRHGLSNRLTGELSFEAAKGFFNGGASSSFLIGNLGVVTLDARISRFDQGGSVMTGSLLSAAFESVGYPLSITLEATQASDNYRDLAAVAGDPRPGSRYLVSTNLDLGKIGILQFTAARQYRPIPMLTLATGEQERSTRISASYRTTLPGGVNLYVDIAHDFDRDNSTSLLFGLSIQFGSRSNAHFAAVRQNGREDYTVGASRPAVLPGDWGYRVEAGTGFIDRVSGAVSHRSDWGFTELQAERVGNGSAVRGTAQGALVVTGNGAYATNRMSGGFALVQTPGVADVTITRENRIVGKTDKNGFLLVPDLPAYVPTRIALDPSSVPATGVVRKDKATMVSSERSGSIIRLDIETTIPATLRLFGNNGDLIAPGTTIRALPSNNIYIAGFDGLVEINAVHRDVALQIDNRPDRGCSVSLPLSTEMKAFSYLGDISCLAHSQNQKDMIARN